MHGNMPAWLANYLDPRMLGAVVLGAILVACLQVGWAGVMRGFAALGPLVRARPDLDRQAARGAMLRVEELAHLRGIACTDRVSTAQPFVAEAASRLANCDRVEKFEIWVEEALADRADRHAQARNAWIAMADAAPAIGMAGTIIGLIRMFSAMDDPATIGPAMALALLTTLYGVILANLIAAPIAARLSDISAQELAWQRDLADRMVAIARRESAALRRASLRDVGSA